MSRDLETDLNVSDSIRQKVQDNDYAQRLYAALCNMGWRHNDDDEASDGSVWACSWRYAGGLVADLRLQNEDYMDFYCSGIMGGTPEGEVDFDIENDLNSLGWIKIPYSKGA